MLTNVQFILNKMFTFLESLVYVVVPCECTFMYSILSPAFLLNLAFINNSKIIIHLLELRR